MKALLLSAFLTMPRGYITGFHVDGSNACLRAEGIPATCYPVLYEAPDPAGPWARVQPQAWSFDLFTWAWTIAVPVNAPAKFFTVRPVRNGTAFLTI